MNSVRDFILEAAQARIRKTLEAGQACHLYILSQQHTVKIVLTPRPLFQYALEIEQIAFSGKLNEQDYCRLRSFTHWKSSTYTLLMLCLPKGSEIVKGRAGIGFCRS